MLSRVVIGNNRKRHSEKRQSFVRAIGLGGWWNLEKPTCQQQPVLGDPLNGLEQVVLEGQISTTRAHLKGRHIQSKHDVVQEARDPGSRAQEAKLETASNSGGDSEMLPFMVRDSCSHCFTAIMLQGKPQPDSPPRLASPERDL